MNADAQVVESWYTRAVEGRRAYAHAGSSPALGTIGLGEKNPFVDSSSDVRAISRSLPLFSEEPS